MGVFDEVGTEQVMVGCLHMGLNLGEDVLFFTIELSITKF
jgi:hypothetical protein